ncbi:hypothetical protein [Arsenicibacter rosenii]|uniref:Uncharacterized protein n=1 Tax=Arsenicibacter rosenii TaxID=1750698 RepID=A0A1S2VC06_9BACT|nr:hypothetical protein [Arsenicibacter rosenii]OIN55845.1 hypothetical protein BLX24_27710 [Arsenicibacter rosenii]
MEELTEKEKAAVLKRFMREHFPFTPLRKAGLFTPEMRGDYKAQAERICSRLGLKTVFEYGAEPIACHISYAGKRPENEPFTTIIPSIYE